jgi:endonuclease/exonuclease/phosphatase (EEP) superfamily protein YafD
VVAAALLAAAVSMAVRGETNPLGNAAGLLAMVVTLPMSMLWVVCNGALPGGLGRGASLAVGLLWVAASGCLQAWLADRAAAGQVPRGLRRWPVTTVLTLGVLLGAGMAVLHWFGTGPFRVTFGLVVLTPYALLVATGVVLLALAACRAWHAAAGMALALALTGAVLPRAVPKPQPLATGPRVTLESLNMRHGQADPGTVVELVRQCHVDVLSLQELTPQAVTALGAAGLWRLLPYRELQPAAGAAGSGLASRFRLRSRALSGQTYFHQPSAALELPNGNALTVVAVHAVAPRPGLPVAGWRDRLLSLPRPTGSPRVLAGDFNATLDHRAFRRLLRAGYRDASAETGRGLTPTWPTNKPGPPFAAIDHVLLSSAIAIRSYTAKTMPGSDHRTIITQLQLPN